MSAENRFSQGNPGNFDVAPRKEAEALSDVALLFPGQGSQTVGMGRELYHEFASAREIFDKADEVLKRPLSRMCFEGPDADLCATENAQTAILTVSIATYNACQEIHGDKLSKPRFVAGHSLGEYSALVLSKSLTFPQALRLVQERGRLMQEAGKIENGGMVAVLGLQEATVEEICQLTNVQIANVNSSDQIVISGRKEFIVNAMGLLKAARAKRIIELPVSGAFHSNLMRHAVMGLAEAIDEMHFEKPEVPIISNVTAGILTDPEEIKRDLKQQIVKPVQWKKSIEFMSTYGVRTFLEIGPGTVLTGLAKRIVQEAKTININSATSVRNFAPSVA